MPLSTQTSRGWVSTTQHKQRSSALVREDGRQGHDREHGSNNGHKGGDRQTQPKQEKTNNAAAPLEA